MRTMRFILGKDPAEHQVGDTAVSSLIMAIAAEGYRVRGVALADDPTRPGRSGLDLLPRPRARLLGTAVRSLAARRSAVHTMFDSPALRSYLRDDDSDLYVAEHSYMAESFLAVRAGQARDRLFVNTHVSESDLFARSGSALRRADAPRLWRDELRVARGCRQLGCLDDDERRRYAAHGVARPDFLDLSMPPARRCLDLPPANLLFLGAADWPPNAAAVHRLLALWPGIRSKAGGAAARLLVAGKGMRAEAFPALDGVEFLGFVDDLDILFAGARALVAPVTDGGGVRVKFLDDGGPRPAGRRHARRGGFAAPLPTGSRPGRGRAGGRMRPAARHRPRALHPLLAGPVRGQPGPLGCGRSPALGAPLAAGRAGRSADRGRRLS